MPGGIIDIGSGGIVFINRTAVFAAACGLALLAGCSGQPAQQEPAASGQNVASSPAEGAQTEQQPGSSTAETVDANDSGASAVGVDPANPPTPIATVTAPYAGDERITSISADLLEVRRSDKLLYGSFRITNKGDFTGTKYLHQMLNGALPFKPTLIDTTNLKEYQSVSPATSGATVKAVANQPLFVHAAWAYPEGAKTVDIRVSDDLPIMTGVPVP